MFYIPTFALLDSATDFAALSCIAALILLSLFSIGFIFHLRLKSRSSRHLQSFNSLWTVRFLLVFFITLWASTELLRVPLFRKQYLYHLLPKLTVAQQANLCKAHIVLSLGFLEPAFLVTLLFLLDVSVKKTSRPRSFFNVCFVLVLSLPISLLQVYLMFFPDPEIRFHKVLQRSWYLPWNSDEHTTVLCAYPLLSTFLFGFFGAIYSLSFLYSFWRVASHVINKALGVRILALAFTVIVALPLQILFMGLSVFWTPDKTVFNGVALVILLSTLSCAVVGEGILVIKPIADALAADVGGGDSTGRGSGQGERTTLTSSSLRPSEDENGVQELGCA